MMSGQLFRRTTPRNAPAMRHLEMTPRESANLYNLLCDNARGWNADLREQLHRQIPATEAFHARLNTERENN